jgi:hypothetical protein
LSSIYTFESRPVFVFLRDEHRWTAAMVLVG